MGLKSETGIERLELDDAVFRGTLARAGASGIGASELCERTGIDPFVTELYPGVDLPCEAYPCRLGGTFVFGLLRGLEGDAEGKVEIWTHGADQIAIVALALDLPEDWFDWRSQPDPEIDRPWQAFRQDDNGNTFELARFAAREDAALYARLWDNRAGAHKQSAFVRRR